MFYRVPGRVLLVALVALATTHSLRAAARSSPTLNEVLARAADATAALASSSQRVVCQENVRQTTVVDPAPIPPDTFGGGGGPAHDPREWAYRDIVASWSITPPLRDGSDGWNEVRNVQSVGRFQPFPNMKTMDARSTALIDATDLPAPFPRFATMFLSALNQPHFEFRKVGETEVGDLAVWEVTFRETVTPSLWTLPLSGSFWLDPSTGRVVRSTIAVRGAAAYSDTMTIDYRVDPTTEFYLPGSLTRRTHITSERSWVDTTGTFTSCRVLPASALADGWSRMESGTTNDLYGIWGASPDDVFAVGPKGTILHFDGRTWSPMAVDGSPHLLSVWGASGRDVFVVGDEGVIIHYDGRRWNTMHSGTTKNLIAVWGASGRDVFAVGYSGTVLHYDGSAWTPMASGTGEDLYGVWGSSSSHVVAVGGTPMPMPGKGLIVCYDGKTWSPMAIPASPFLFGAWGTSAKDVHAVGVDLAALRWDGQAWRPAPVTLPRVQGAISGLTRLWGSGPDDIYAAGFNGVLAHFDGNRWTPVSRDTTEQLGGVIAFSPNDVFVVGGAGIILRYSPEVR